GAHLLRQQVVQADAIAASRVITETSQTGPGQYERETTLIRNQREYTFTRSIASDNLDTGTDSLQNPRTLASDLRVERGQVFDSTGRVIAGRTVYTDSGYVQRTYPVPNMSYVLGYFNPTIYGLGGFEADYDRFLSGAEGSNPIVDEENRILHRPVVGSDVYTTLVPAVQDAAAAALGQRKGAVVVIDIPSGAIQALVSYPHIDPNGLAFNPNADDWAVENKGIIDYWNSVADEKQRPDLPMLPRATQGLYPPGSTFKTVTLAAAVDLGKAKPDTIFTDTGKIQVEAGGYVHVDCATCRPANHPSNLFTLMEGYQWSLNVVFAELAVYIIKPDPLVQYSQQFGFGRDYGQNNPALGVRVAPSRLGDAAFLATPNGIAATSYGQGQMQATPFEMAMVAAAVAHGGELPRPYLVSKVVNPRGATVQEAQPGVLTRVVSPQSAAVLNEMMMLSVERGWASGAAIKGFQVGGKTGTAETGRGTTHAWFIGVAGTDRAHPQYAVAALVEEGGEGSRVAVPVARAALAAALGTK
ncbi:MAG TPA: penicillin-binding transpeptidase domain-containing protein, partial [Chloroflexia bacterium]|nr:penicillin-binding transpeptidase domain-containing protein [Chloroflexia bacterium]